MEICKDCFWSEMDLPPNRMVCHCPQELDRSCLRDFGGTTFSCNNKLSLKDGLFLANKFELAKRRIGLS